MPLAADYSPLTSHWPPMHGRLCMAADDRPPTPGRQLLPASCWPPTTSGLALAALLATHFEHIRRGRARLCRWRPTRAKCRRPRTARTADKSLATPSPRNLRRFQKQPDASLQVRRSHLGSQSAWPSGGLKPVERDQEHDGVAKMRRQHKPTYLFMQEWYLSYGLSYGEGDAWHGHDDC